MSQADDHDALKDLSLSPPPADDQSIADTPPADLDYDALCEIVAGHLARILAGETVFARPGPPAMLTLPPCAPNADLTPITVDV